MDVRSFGRTEVLQIAPIGTDRDPHVLAGHPGTLDLGISARAARDGAIGQANRSDHAVEPDEQQPPSPAVLTSLREDARPVFTGWRIRDDWVPLSPRAADILTR